MGARTCWGELSLGSFTAGSSLLQTTTGSHFAFYTTARGVVTGSLVHGSSLSGRRWEEAAEVLQS